MLGLSNQESYSNYSQSWLEDTLKVISASEPLVVPLIAARSIGTEESLEKRVRLIYQIKKSILIVTLSWIDDVLKVLNEIEPQVIPLVAACMFDLSNQRNLF